MANASLRFKDRLEDASNFSPWRERIALMLEEHGLWEFIEGYIVPPRNPSQLVMFPNRFSWKLRFLCVFWLWCFVKHFADLSS
jgi:hypothetical protein